MIERNNGLMLFGDFEELHNRIAGGRNNFRENIEHESNAVVMVLLDVSGSMNNPLSFKSDMTPSISKISIWSTVFITGVIILLRRGRDQVWKEIFCEALSFLE